MNAQKSSFDKSQSVSELNVLKNRIRNRVIDNISLLKDSYQTNHYRSFPINAVKYSQLQDVAFPIVKFGLDDRSMKNLFYPEKQINLNEKLTDLMNDDYLKNLMNNMNNNENSFKEFRGESEFISTDKPLKEINIESGDNNNHNETTNNDNNDIIDNKDITNNNVKNLMEGNEIKNRSNSYELNGVTENNEKTENISKKSNSETKIKGNFEETTKFIPLEQTDNVSIFRTNSRIKENKRGSLNEAYQILRSIDEIQNKSID